MTTFRNNMASTAVRTGFIFVVAVLSLQVDAYVKNPGREPNWQDRLVEWWMSVRKFGASLLLGGMGLSWLIVKLRRKQAPDSKEFEKKKTGKDGSRVRECSSSQLNAIMEREKVDRLKIFFGTQTGKAKSLAESLHVEATKMGLISEVLDLKNYEPEDSLMEEADTCVFIISTYVDGNPPDSVKWFYKWLEEASHDFRVQKSLLKDLNYAVFGLGNSLYEDNFNMVGRNVDKRLEMLSARRVFPLGTGDENLTNSEHGGTENDFKFWSAKFLSRLKGRVEKSSEGSCHPSVETECAQDSYCQDQGDSEKNKLQSDKVLTKCD